jgi:hypothetical protein
MQQLTCGLRVILAVGAVVGATANVAALKGAQIVHKSAGLSVHLINLLQNIDADGGEVQNGINVTVGANLLRDALKDLEVDNEAGDVDVLDKAAINSLVASLGQIQANASKATPGMQKFVQKVTDMIDNDLVGKVKSAHKQNQKVADALVKNFLQCKHSKTTADRTIGKLMSTAKTSSRHHKVCRSSEQKKWTAKTLALNLLAQKKKLMDSEKGKLEILRRDPNAEANVCHPSKTPWQHPSNYYGTWLASNLRYFANREKLWFAQKLRWQKAKDAHDRYRPIALRIEKVWKSQKLQCDQFQKTLEGSTCGGAKLMFSSCDQRYWGCYSESQELYKQTTPFLRKQEKDRKAEWRALMRIKCILDIFMDGDADEDKIDECKQKTHSTTHLNLNIKRVPNAEKCSSIPNTPCSTAFHNQEYNRLPRNARAGKCSQCVVFSEGFPTRPLYWLQARNYHPDTNTWTNRGAGPDVRSVHRTGTKPWVSYEKEGFGSKRKILALKGTSSTGLYLGNVVPSKYTVCIMARYTGPRRGRILQTSAPNWLLGHWNGQSGVAYLNGWKTHHMQQKDVKDRDDWVAMCGRNGGKSPGNIMSNGKSKGRHAGGSRPHWLGVNMGGIREPSDFAISEILVFQEQLPDQEMTKVQNYLMSKLSKQRKPGPDKNYRDSATTCTAPQLSKLDAGWRDKRTFRCMDGTCIKRKGMCNGYANCKDKSDEKICSKLLTKPNRKFVKPARSCSIKQRLKLRPGMGDLRTFRCWDGSCTHITGKCNGFANCADGSDEKLCTKVSLKKKAAVIKDSIKMLTKYETRWPHCQNLFCFTGTLFDAKKTCAANKLCDGFSFTRTNLKSGKGRGGGCYKQKCKVEFGGYGHGSHGYVAKYVKTGVAKCKNLKVNYPIWGRGGAGVDISAYAEGIRWIGCNGNGCSAKSFYCKDNGNSLEFGTNSGAVMRSLFGKDVPNSFKTCATSARPMDIGNAPTEDDAVKDMCDALGYKSGKILKRTSNWCPYVVSVKGDKKKGMTDKFSLFWKPKTAPKTATKIKCMGHKSGEQSTAEQLGLSMAAAWTDTEGKCSSEIPKDVWGKCKTEARDKIAIEVTYKNGYHGFAYYEGVKDKWGKSFPNLAPKMQKGFFKVDPSGPLYKLDFKSSITGTYYPMAWRGLSNAWSRNYDLTSTARNCNDAKANRKGWGSMKVELFC